SQAEETSSDGVHQQRTQDECHQRHEVDDLGGGQSLEEARSLFHASPSGAVLAPVPSWRMASSDVPAGSSPTSRPSRMTRIRSDIPITSGSSLEAIKMALPSAASWRISRYTATLAPTSMPRVGSSSRTSRGETASHLASTIFCWLPPERYCTSWSRSRATTSKVLNEPATSRRTVEVRPGNTAR